MQQKHIGDYCALIMAVSGVWRTIREKAAIRRSHAVYIHNNGEIIAINDEENS